MSKRVVWIICLAVLVVSVVSVLYRLALPQTIPFDTRAWIIARANGDYAQRRAMLQDLEQLLRSGAIVDKGSAQQLLGPADRGGAGDTWDYRLGSEEAWSTGGYERWLELSFNASGRFISHRVRRDAKTMPEPQLPMTAR